jgi:hypothetical protein
MAELMYNHAIKLLHVVAPVSSDALNTDSVNNVMKNQTGDEFTVNSEMGDHRFKNTH